MRGWMNDAKSYIPPVGINEVMRAGGIGKVIASSSPQYAVGDLVSAALGVQEYAVIPQAAMKHAGLFKIDSRVGSVTQWLNVLGMPGMLYCQHEPGWSCNGRLAIRSRHWVMVMSRLCKSAAL